MLHVKSFQGLEEQKRSAKDQRLDEHSTTVIAGNEEIFYVIRRLNFLKCASS